MKHFIFLGLAITAQATPERDFLDGKQKEVENFKHWFFSGSNGIDPSTHTFQELDGPVGASRDLLLGYTPVWIQAAVFNSLADCSVGTSPAFLLGQSASGNCVVTISHATGTKTSSITTVVINADSSTTGTTINYSDDQCKIQSGPPDVQTMNTKSCIQQGSMYSYVSKVGTGKLVLPEVDAVLDVKYKQADGTCTTPMSYTGFPKGACVSQQGSNMSAKWGSCSGSTAGVQFFSGSTCSGSAISTGSSGVPTTCTAKYVAGNGSTDDDSEAFYAKYVCVHAPRCKLKACGCNSAAWTGGLSWCGNDNAATLQSSWCQESSSNCESNCNGAWCAAPEIPGCDSTPAVESTTACSPACEGLYFIEGANRCTGCNPDGATLVVNASSLSSAITAAGQPTPLSVKKCNGECRLKDCGCPGDAGVPSWCANTNTKLFGDYCNKNDVNCGNCNGKFCY